MMGLATDAMVFLIDGKDAVQGLATGSESGGPVGVVGQILSTAGAAGQVVGTLTDANPRQGFVGVDIPVGAAFAAVFIPAGSILIPLAVAS